MVVVSVNGDRYEAKGRLADMIIWLVKHASDIRNGSTGIRFSFRGPRLMAVIEREEIVSN